jgi:hypothetical protein
MATAAPLTPVTYTTNLIFGDKFTTPEQIQDFAQSMLDKTLGSAAPGMRPKVEVSAHPGGLQVSMSVTGEGFGGPRSDTRVYPISRLLEEDQIRAATWLQCSQLLSRLEPVPTEGE